MRARFILFHYETPTIGSTIPREFLRERLFFLVEVRRKPKFFLMPPKLRRRKEDRTQKGVTVSIQTLTLQEDEIGYGVSYESNRYVNVMVSYFPVLGLYALL